ncbi:indole-3-glycerol phosphate synthase TrpC [uncultured Methanobrevibacter sp.]|uniref:indole-3-glycerol phosphate synthase TrpC n=1 Tax=uncultured Methanobrevibacter sp. TaxID=253161 RepID=UPI0025EA5848|nr:indole-3-glycerol phosphate synthase TrpC [uncultured Methanobrevibacter sp.]
MILDTIVKKTEARLRRLKENMPLEKLKEKVDSLDCNNDLKFEKSLKKEGMSYICEIKKASPSKGLIVKDEEFDPLKISKEYEDGGASAISILTEPYFFKGSNEYLSSVSQNTILPILRKDFIIDEYMIYEAKLLGADAVLLIASILDKEILKKFIKLSYSLGMSALVESHNQKELEKALDAKARIIGINNRDLKTFKVDFNNVIKLRKKVPSEIIFISESGVKTKEDIDLLKENNIDGVLIGELLMKSQDKKAMIKYLDGS